MRTFSIISEHKKAAEINDLIIKSRFEDVSFKQIAIELKKAFGLSISHATIASYYKDNLAGDSLDDAKSNAIVKAFEDAKDDSQEQPTEIDPVRLSQLMLQYDPQGKKPLGALYAKITALCEANLQNHLEGKERLKTTYIKYLKDLKAIIGNKSEV